jgi:hypothetical protein
MPRPQFSLRSLFVLTALVAVGCLVGPPIVGLGVAAVIVIPLVLLVGAGMLASPILLLCIVSVSIGRAIIEAVPQIWHSLLKKRHDQPGD